MAHKVLKRMKRGTDGLYQPGDVIDTSGWKWYTIRRYRDNGYLGDEVPDEPTEKQAHTPSPHTERPKVAARR